MEAGGGGGGGPAPFLVKTYEMIDDTSTDNIVSWSLTMSSFVVWDPPEFSRLLLPTYFKHNNFSSFIRQLNTYGFRKIDPERWEFANDEFVKGKKHLLKNIHRRKPIHSHSNPPAASGLGSERAAFEEEIERLTRERTTLQADVWRFRNQNTVTKSQLEDLGRRVKDMEERQKRMTLFLAKAVKNPVFVDHLIRIAGASSTDFSVLSKKRRQLSMVEDNDESQEHADNCSSDENSGGLKVLDVGHMIPQDFSSKLKLELCPAMVNSRSSNEGAESPQMKQLEGNQLRIECMSFVPELMDTGASLCPKKSVPLPWQVRNFDDSDDHMSCHLNLTLASSPLQFGRSLSLERGLNSASFDTDSGTEELRTNNVSNECHEVLGKDKSNRDTNKSVVQESIMANNLEPVPVTGKNDVFWEQFLTERPGSSEEASSRLRSNPEEKGQEAKRLGNDTSRGRNSIDKLTL